MPFCSNCGNKIEEHDKFCPNCGTPNRSSKDTASTKPAQGTILEHGSYGQSNSELPKGFEIEGRYRIEQKLGKGGFGTVYKAWDSNVDEYKALKVIDNIFYDDKRVITSLKKETKLLLKLNSKHVVRIFDVHLQGDVKFIDMEYIDGGDLVDLMLSYEDEKVPEERVIEIAKQICQGMIDIHAHNIIHKDLKPQNVILTKSGQIKIMDFGISETFRSSMSRMKETSKSGTPAYMSPEQLLGKDVGKESDIWSFGVMLYELLSGKQLYTGSSLNEVYFQIQNREYTKIDPVSSKLNFVIEKCLVKKHINRYRLFEDVLNQLTKKKINKQLIITEDVEYNELAKEHKTNITNEIIETKINELSNHDHISKTGIEMIRVKSGEFIMGSNEIEAKPKEIPKHKVTIDSFYIGKYPVSQQLWKGIMGNNPSEYIGERKPVENVSWYDAVEFCNKLSDKEGLEKCYIGSVGNIRCNWNANGYRLPTEAEWEFSARGGGSSELYKYSGSNNIDDVCVYLSKNGIGSKEIGTKMPNELGIYDMSGNVWEWCWDLYGEYISKTVSNPTGSTEGTHRVYRGGCWYSYSSHCRCAFRSKNHPMVKNAFIGFRIARSIMNSHED